VRAIKENFVPPTDFPYPHMAADAAEDVVEPAAS
jgi:hypothetical protein